MSQVRSFGIFVFATTCAHQVFDLESRALLVVPFMDLDVSPFIGLVLRSSSITAATFGGLCPEESSSMFGVPHWCGDSLALVTANLSQARAASVNGGLAPRRAVAPASESADEMPPQLGWVLHSESALPPSDAAAFAVPTELVGRPLACTGCVTPCPPTQAFSVQEHSVPQSGASAAIRPQLDAHEARKRPT